MGASLDIGLAHATEGDDHQRAAGSGDDARRDLRIYAMSADSMLAAMRYGRLPERLNQSEILDDALDRYRDCPMAKVTGKFQVTLPKAVVDRFGIRGG